MDYDRLRELQEKFEENPRRYFAPLANEYRKGGQPKRAIEICRAQLAQMPGHMSGQIVYGQSLYEAGEFDEARKVFEGALTLDPENLIALRSLGDLSLQSGNTVEARSWYTRLLDADPKDTAVIALVDEIDKAADAGTPVPEEIPGVDTDAGDQAIPFITDATGGPVGEGPAPSPETAFTSTESATEAARDVSPVAREDSGGRESVEAGAESARESEPQASHESEPRASHESEPHAARESEPQSEDAAGALEASPAAESESVAIPAGSTGTDAAPPEGLERHYPVETPAEAPPPAPESEIEIGLGAEGLHSRVEPTGKIGAEDLRSLAQTPAQPMGTEGLRGTEPAEKVPVGTEGLKGTPPPAPLAGATGSRSDDEEALDTWTPPPGATVHDRREARKEDRMFSGPAPEPFVNETMAQLYLQQGYRQLALRVYYQLAETRPGDQALKDRIAQIEAEDRAAHPEAAAVERPKPEAAPPPAEPTVPHQMESKREPAPVDTPKPPAPRAPSIEAPTPGRGAESEEAPRFDRTPVDSPPPPPSRPSAPPRERESIESPVRDERRAEPVDIAARQPSIREFFATLGRRRPPRAVPQSTAAHTTAGYGNTAQSSTYGASSVPPAPTPRPTNTGAPPTASQPIVPMGGAPTSASLDAVFAGATVNPADSRAASRLAGAFSGTSGASRPTPPTPPMPTPRVNQRVPAAQESEEDVAKFRAWLDGLTGE
ncbi:MAG TPA: tetratricopeptide repeat protein [Gemmatimonadaceae bacterium]|nr:tetratricopeptide repeat protein [Gemmatimonadaceae bacterium]